MRLTVLASRTSRERTFTRCPQSGIEKGFVPGVVWFQSPSLTPYCPSVTNQAVVTLIGPAVEPGDVIALKRGNRCSKREKNLSEPGLR